MNKNLKSIKKKASFFRMNGKNFSIYPLCRIVICIDRYKPISQYIL